jgi:hypothetical protein
MNIGYPNRIKFEDLAIGDVVVYEAFDGEERRILITSLDEQLKNERSGFGGYIVNDANQPVPNNHPSNFLRKSLTIDVWGYTEQVTSHEKAS